MFSLVLSLFCCAVFSVVFSFTIISMGKIDLVAYFNCLFMPYDSKCSVYLHHVKVGWSAVCHCSIIWSYSLPFDQNAWIHMLMLV